MVNAITKTENAPIALLEERQSTTADIARAAGVSTATVSYVLSNRPGARVSEATRSRVLHAAKRLGYRRNSLASALRTGQTHTVAIVSTHMAGRGSSSRFTYVKDLMLATSVAATRAGLNAVMLVDKPLEELSVAEVTDRRVDGLILFGMYHGTDWVRAVLQTGTPCVEINSSVGDYQVHTDNAGGARQAVAHLVSLGHRRIVHLRGAEVILAARQREAGFRDALREAGLSEAASVAPDLAALAGFMQSPQRPTAIFCFNDETACQVGDLLHGLNLRVPQDVSLIGFDNSLHSEVMRPRLTTVQNPLDALASAAIGLLQAQAQGAEPDAKVVTIPTHLVVRDSTALKAVTEGENS